MNLKVAQGFGLSKEIVTKTVAILAQRRKGKTYTANVMAEEMVRAGIPWVAIDPTGAWYGLRASADGKKPGLPVTILGGDHGDVPLERTAGALVADLVVDAPGWYVLDLSHFESKTAERQFATDFAERFYRNKGKQSDAMHLFIDEADIFVPQQSPSGDKRMLGAFEAIVRRGGIRGIGTTLISQRAAVVNKNVLEQIDILITLRTLGPNDQKAIEAYVKANGSPDEVTELLGSLASLKLGEAWVYEPGGDPALFKRVQIRERTTFNSSATPKAGKRRVEPRQMADVDLAELEQKMSETIEKAKQEDPAALRKENAKLKSDVRRLESEVSLASKAPEPKVEIIEIVPETLLATVRDILSKVKGETTRLANSIEGQVNSLSDTLDRHEREAKEGRSKALPAHQVRQGRIAKGALSADRTPTRQPKLVPVNGEVTLLKGERRMLATLAQHHPMVMTRSQLGTLAGFSPKGGTYRNYYGKLKRNGLIVEDATGVTISQEGFSELGAEVPPAPETTEERLEVWRKALLAGERKMLDYLVEHYGEDITREELGEATGYTASGGTFRNYLGKLVRNGLAETNGQQVAAGDVLFIGA